VVTLVLSLGVGERLHSAPSERAWLALIYLIIFGSLVAYSAYMFLLAHVRPTLATSYAYVNPVVAVALGAMIAGEAITGLGIAAMVVILAGVVLVMAARKSQNA
jgi:drug/metabolite transporter (DMT)-like permease